jgi:hypothetical protein
MKAHERLKTAIDFLQKADPNLRHRHIMQRVHYASPQYLSDMLRGEKNLSERFLDRLESEFFVSKQWIKTGKGVMMKHTNVVSGIISNNTLPVKDRDKAIKVLVQIIARHEAKLTERPFDDCLAEILKQIEF